MSIVKLYKKIDWILIFLKNPVSNHSFLVILQKQKNKLGKILLSHQVRETLEP